MAGGQCFRRSPLGDVARRLPCVDLGFAVCICSGGNAEHLLNGFLLTGHAVLRRDITEKNTTCKPSCYLVAAACRSCRYPLATACTGGLRWKPFRLSIRPTEVLVSPASRLRLLIEHSRSPPPGQSWAGLGAPAANPRRCTLLLVIRPARGVSLRSAATMLQTPGAAGVVP